LEAEKLAAEKKKADILNTFAEQSQGDGSEYTYESAESEVETEVKESDRRENIANLPMSAAKMQHSQSSERGV